MENNNKQDMINLVCKFLEEAEKNDEKIFFPDIYAERWGSVLKSILDLDDITKVKTATIPQQEYSGILDCLHDLDFLYMFFQAMDDLNIFNLIDQEKLQELSFSNHRISGYTDTVVIPGVVENLPTAFFQGCKGLKKIVIQSPSKLSTLPRGFLLGCTDLEELILPNSISKIGVLAIDPEEIPNLKIKLPAGRWNVNIAGNDSIIEYWKTHVCRID